MAVTKFTSLDEARHALLARPVDERLSARIRSLWKFSSRLVHGGMPRGVTRFESIEQANAARDAWIKRRAQALRAGGPIRSTHRD